MSAEDTSALVRRYVMAHDSSDPNAVLDLLTPDFVLHLAGMPDLDREGYLQVFGAYRAAFPDMRHTIEDQVVEGEKVVTRATVRATHQQEFQGLPATGKPVTVSLMAINRVVDGKIAEDWSILDGLSLLQQIGAMQAPA